MTIQTIAVTQQIKGGEVEVRGTVVSEGRQALQRLLDSERAYVLDCFINATPTNHWPGVPSRTAASLRRIGHLSRKRPDARVPDLDGALVAAGNWRPAIGGLLVRAGNGAGAGTQVPIIMPGSAVSALNPRRPITIRIKEVSS